MLEQRVHGVLHGERRQSLISEPQLELIFFLLCCAKLGGIFQQVEYGKAEHRLRGMQVIYVAGSLKLRATRRCWKYIVFNLFLLLHT